MAAAVSVGVFASAAAADHAVRHADDGVVPMFCGAPDGSGGHSAVYSIPSTTQLIVRLTWAVKNADQATIFLDNQKLTFTVTDTTSGDVLYARVPSPEYGDKSFWSGPVYEELVAEGKRQKLWRSSHREPTGVFLAPGQTVRISYELTANAKTDDGFGYRFNARETMSSGSTCTVTGV